jgi:thiamine biosynthesis lipoprotein
MRPTPLTAALMAGAAVLVATAPQAQAWSFHADHVLGTSLDMVVVAASRQAAEMAFSVAQGEIARLDTVLSGWRPDSELARLNAGSLFQASPDLFAVIQASEDWRARTGGAFSARLGRLESLLKSGAPGSAALAGKLNGVPVDLNPGLNTIARPADVTFAVDGIAKGYVIDRALDVASALPGVHGMMLDIGGDLRCRGAAPGKDGWRVGIAAPCAADNAAPAATIRLADNAVATSGLGLRGASAIDPIHGAYASDVTMASVVAPRAADADAMASAFSVMAPKDSIVLADATPGVAARIVTADGTVHVSAGWQAIQVADNAPLRFAAASTLPAGFSATIDYEIPDLGFGRRPRNPYVSIWVSDAAGNPVRTLLFLASKPRYMSENFVFWGKVGAVKPDLLYSVTKPTRPPGRYSVVWDGKDDAGHPLPQGKYVVNIEGAREHGGHNLQHIDLTLGESGVTGDAAAQGELGAAHVRYGANP